MRFKNMNIFEKIIRKIGYTFHVRKMRKKLLNKDFTLISQNCLGGVIYHMLGMQFTSPTINMFIEDENFIKLVKNLKYYMAIPAEPLTDKYIDPINSSIIYPKIKIDDIEICCLHFKDCKDAVDAWEKRRKRINFNNILVIANSWNMHENEKHINNILDTGYRTICFTYGDFHFDNCLKLKGDYWKLDERGIVRPNITDYMPHSYKRYFEDYINIVSWINGEESEF